MKPFQKHPDLVPHIIDWFEDQLPAYHIAQDLTGWQAPEIWITVQPSGGFINRVRTGVAQMDANVYAPSKPEAFSIAMDAVRTFMQMPNYTGSDVVITGVSCSYPADISDPINENPRFVFDVTINYRTN